MPHSFWALLLVYTFPVFTTLLQPQQDQDLFQPRSLDLQPRDDDGREVWITSKTDADWSQMLLHKNAEGYYDKVFLVHSWLFVQGNDKDGPLRIEIAVDQQKLKSGAPPEASYNVRVLDLGTANKDKVEKSEGGQRTYLQGKTKLTNKDFLDPETGKGIVARAWGKNPVYKAGQLFANDYDEDTWKVTKKNLNTCNDMLERIMQEMPEKLPVNPRTAILFEISAQASSADAGRNLKINLNKLYLENAGSSAGDNTRTIWNMDYATENHQLQGERNAKFCKRSLTIRSLIKRDGCGEWKQMYESANVKDPMTGKALSDGATINIDQDVVTDKPAKPNGETGVNLGSDDSVKPPKTTIAIASVAGKLQVVKTVAKEILAAAGPLGDLAAIAFVILDFVNGDWKAGAFGLAGLAIAGALAFAGPVGWVAGAVVAVLFAILPGALDTKPAAHIGNAVEIIQFKFFADRDHTGNEKCQEQGDKDCQALYGPGTLATAFGWENFDAVAFLIHFNRGYPMSIPDIAKSFKLLDAPVTAAGAITAGIGSILGVPGLTGGRDDIATIACNNKKRTPTRFGMTGDDPSLCNHAEFKFDRSKVKLPIIDEMADKIHDRIIPAPDGDCKIVVYPDEQDFPKYDLSVLGFASAISCGLNEGTDVQGTIVPVSSGSESTDGQNGAYVQAPDPKPFAPISDKDNLCIGYDNSDDLLCLPSGTYTNMDGLGYVNRLTVPGDGFSLEAKWTNTLAAARGPAPPPRPVDHTYTATETFDTLKGLNADMRGIHQVDHDNGRFIIKSPKDPVMVCLFPDTDLKGKPSCFGEGGGDVPKDIAESTVSIQVSGGANVWIYVDKYNDKGGALLRGNVHDLAQQDYGNNDNFSKKVHAIWVYNGS